jgi:hypothetical protein
VNWSIERYVRLYRNDTAEWALVPWQARGLFDELLRKADLDGTIACGRMEPAAACAVLLRAPPGDVPEIERLLGILLADGCIEDVPAAGSRGRHLRFPNYRAAQETPMSGSERQAKYRANLRAKSAQVDGSDKVTPLADPAEPREEDHGQGEQGALIPLPRPEPSTMFGRFVAATWPDVEDPDGLHRRLQQTFPRVDLLGEAKKALLWEQAQGPRRRKRDHARFLSNWMGNARATLVAPAQGRREVVGFDREGKPIYAA